MKQYTLLAESTEPVFDLEALNLNGGDHSLVVMAVQGNAEEGEPETETDYSEETVYTEDFDVAIIQKATLTKIADSIRDKTGKTNPILTENFSKEIDEIPEPTGTRTITSNGTHDVTNYASAKVEVPVPENYYWGMTGPAAFLDGEIIETITENGVYDTTFMLTIDPAYPIPGDDRDQVPSFCKTIKVEVPTSAADPKLQEKTVAVNGDVTPDSGYDGLSKVTVNVPLPQGSRTITTNGTHDVYNYASVEVDVPTAGGEGYAPVIPDDNKLITSNGLHSTYNDSGEIYENVLVNVNLRTQTKTVTANGTVTPDDDYNALSEVVVAIPEFTRTILPETYDPSGTTKYVFDDAPDVAYDISSNMRFWDNAGIYYGAIRVDSTNECIYYMRADGTTDELTGDVVTAYTKSGGWADSIYKTVRISGYNAYASNEEYLFRGWFAMHTTLQGGAKVSVSYNDQLIDMDTGHRIVLECADHVMTDAVTITYG